MVSIPDIGGAIDPLTHAISQYGEGILPQTVLPAFLVMFLMLGAISRFWK